MSQGKINNNFEALVMKNALEELVIVLDERRSKHGIFAGCKMDDLYRPQRHFGTVGMLLVKIVNSLAVIELPYANPSDSSQKVYLCLGISSPSTSRGTHKVKFVTTANRSAPAIYKSDHHFDFYIQYPSHLSSTHKKHPTFRPLKPG